MRSSKLLPVVALSVFLLTMQIVMFGQSHTATPQPSTPSAQEVFAPFWTLEAGWHSELEIRNNLAQGNLAVTPVLHSADGVEVVLAPLTLAPDQSASLALPQAVPAVGLQALGGHTMYGSVSLRYSAASSGNLYAAVLLKHDGYPISFHFDFAALIPTFTAGSYESMWWLPRATANGYLVISNLSGHTINASQVLTSADGLIKTVTALSLPAQQSLRINMREAVQQAGLTGTQGGIAIVSTADAGFLSVSNILYDDAVDFSALLRVFMRDANGTTQANAVRAPLIGLRNPDPALGYPAGTLLQPWIFLRNAGSAPLAAALSLNWHSPSTSGSTQVPLAPLAPGASRLVDLTALQQSAGTKP